MSALAKTAVSYVVTVYNKAAFLPDVLAAIAAEHVATGGEIVLVDDGSTDGSPALLAAFVKANPAARVLVQPNRGVSAATNRGIGSAACPYIRLVDADDIIVPGSTSHLREALEATGCDFAYGRMAHAPEERPKAAVKHRVMADPLKLMLKTQPFIPSMSLGTSSVMKAVMPLPEDIATAQDFALGIRLAPHTCFVEIDALCCIVPQASGGLSANKARMFRDTALMCLRFGEEMHWGRSYRRIALQRNAGRARNYFRRHVQGGGSKVVMLGLVAAALKLLPIPFPYRRTMSYIAAAYDSIETLAEPG